MLKISTSLTGKWWWIWERRKMKQPKKLTREQKQCVSAHHLNPNHWALVEETEFYYKVVNKETGKTKMLDKFRR